MLVRHQCCRFFLFKYCWNKTYDDYHVLDGTNISGKYFLNVWAFWLISLRNGRTWSLTLVWWLSDGGRFINVLFVLGTFWSSSYLYIKGYGFGDSSVQAWNVTLSNQLLEPNLSFKIKTSFPHLSDHLLFKETVNNIEFWREKGPLLITKSWP